jgi:hypothetical protein
VIKNVEEEVADLKETKPCTGPESADRVAADGLKEYFRRC